MDAVGPPDVNPITEVTSISGSTAVSSTSVRNLGEAVTKAVKILKKTRTKNEHLLFSRTNNVSLTKIDPESDSSQSCEPRSEQNSVG